MPEAVVFILRAVVLVLLWGFIVAAIVAVRHDLVDAPVRSTSGPSPTAGGRPEPRSRSRGRRAPVVARQLVVVDGEQAGTTVALGGLPISIGRAPDCGLSLHDDYASNHHARLVPAGDGWQLEDTGSTNGSFVADKRVTAPTTVTPGMPIRIGRTVMELRP